MRFLCSSWIPIFCLLLIYCLVSFKHRLKEFTCVAALKLGNLFRCACKDNLTASGAAFGTKVDNVVSYFDNIEVVLDDDNCVARICKSVQNVDKLVDIGCVQTCCGLVQNVESSACGALTELSCQLRAVLRRPREW